MQALGLIETKGVVAAIVGADAMLKAADVNLLEKTKVGGGLVVIAVTGDVGAVKAAVEAGVAAIKMLNDLLLISQHVIPRPHECLDEIIISEMPIEDKNIEFIDSIEEIDQKEEVDEKDVHLEEIEKMEDEKSSIEDLDNKEVLTGEEFHFSKIDLKKLNNKKVVDSMVVESGLEETIDALSKLKVAELRNLARKYVSFGIKGREISKAGKDLLLKEFKKYYEQNS